MKPTSKLLASVIKINIAWILILLTTITAVFTGCVKRDFDIPPVNIPYVDFSANTTIMDLKKMYKGVLLPITSDIIIKGIVVANDESGNFYKTIVLQDESGGIELKMDASYLYNTYKLGQEVYIKCNGLYLGDYNKLIQIGYIYENSVGRIPEPMIEKHVYLNGLPNAKHPLLNPTPLTILLAYDSTRYSTLVRFDNVYFSEPNEYLVKVGEDAYNHIIYDENLRELFLRTSKYSDFAMSKTPAGRGAVIGILSVYQSDVQLYLRDLNDMQGFANQALPYIILERFNDKTLGNMVAISKKDSALVWNIGDYGDELYAQMSGYNGSTFENEDWLISPSFNLDLQSNEVLSFKTARNYDGDDLKLMISMDYVGFEDPDSATWYELSGFILSQGDWEWLTSGDIDMSGFSGTNVHIAFKYTCNSSDAATWELDDIFLRNDPTASPITPYVAMLTQNFNNSTLGNWTAYSVTGTQVWAASSYSGDMFAKVSGYDGSNYTNEDWLISPAINMDMFSDEKLEFRTAKNYSGNNIEVYISTNYSGSGDPTLASWTALSGYSLSGGSWAWVNSGAIDISSYTGTAYVAFKYTSTTSAASTWELDDIIIKGK